MTPLKENIDYTIIDHFGDKMVRFEPHLAQYLSVHKFMLTGTGFLTDLRILAVKPLVFRRESMSVIRKEKLKEILE
jgi:hypothetical protein